MSFHHCLSRFATTLFCHQRYTLKISLGTVYQHDCPCSVAPAWHARTRTSFIILLNWTIDPPRPFKLAYLYRSPSPPSFLQAVCPTWGSLSHATHTWSGQCHTWCPRDSSALYHHSTQPEDRQTIDWNRTCITAFILSQSTMPFNSVVPLMSGIKRKVKTDMQYAWQGLVFL